MARRAGVLVDSFQLSSKPFVIGHPGGESVALIEGARRHGSSGHQWTVGTRASLSSRSCCISSMSASILPRVRLSLRSVARPSRSSVPCVIARAI